MNTTTTNNYIDGTIAIHRLFDSYGLGIEWLVHVESVLCFLKM